MQSRRRGRAAGAKEDDMGFVIGIALIAAAIGVWQWIDLQLYAATWDLRCAADAADATEGSSTGKVRTPKSPPDAS